MPDGHGIDQASQRATGAAERSAQGGGGGGDFVNKVILPTDQDSARLLFLPQAIDSQNCLPDFATEGTRWNLPE